MAWDRRSGLCGEGEIEVRQRREQHQHRRAIVERRDGDRSWAVMSPISRVLPAAQHEPGDGEEQQRRQDVAQDCRWRRRRGR